MSLPDLLDWLLEPENPSARYLTLTRLLGRSEDDPDVAAARAAIPGWGPARAILDAQWPEGYWVRPGVGYSPKHKATVWQVLFLAALGAPRSEALDRACAYVLDHSRLADGRFSENKTGQGAYACLNGNLLRAFAQLGYEDPRLDESREALAEMVARDGFCCRYNAPTPKPARMRDGQPCAWGVVKTLGAFAEIPKGARSPAVQSAIAAGVAFLGSDPLCTGKFPTATRPSPLWRKFGFPLGYTSDLLEALEVLSILGVEHTPQIAAALDVVRAKQNLDGRWLLEHQLHNTWASFGELGQPDKWVTLRARRVLAAWEV